jgi:S-disulfanyl-L-cysteine oxidoreductase SoxD
MTRFHQAHAVVLLLVMAAAGAGARNQRCATIAPAVVLMTQPPATSVWDGVFTKQQADRGKEAYSRACTYCHRDDLSGNEDGAPALRGAEFSERWKDRPLSEFYFVLRETMPQDEPASLTAQAYVDIISFILSGNNMSAGEKELPTDMESLKLIKFTSGPRY